MAQTLSRIITAVLLAGSLTATATETGDTVKVINKPEKVIIGTGKGGHSVKVYRNAAVAKQSGPFLYSYTVTGDSLKDGEEEISEESIIFQAPFINKGKKIRGNANKKWRYRTGIMGDVYIGYSLVSGDRHGLKDGWEYGFDNLAYIGVSSPGGSSTFTFGFGIGGATYGAEKGLIGRADNRGRLSFVPGPENSHDCKGRLRMFNLRYPITYRQRIAGEIGFTLGATMVMNTYAKASGSYKIDNLKTEGKYKGLHQRFLTADFKAGINLGGGLEVYCKWSPVSTFSAQWGPADKHISVGIAIYDF